MAAVGPNEQPVGVVQVDAASPGVSWLADKLPMANTQGGPTLDRRGNVLLPTEKGLYWRDGEGEGEAKATAHGG